MIKDKLLKRNWKKTLPLMLSMLLATVMLSACSLPIPAGTYERSAEEVESAEGILLLKEGNERFVSGRVLNDDLSKEKREVLTVEGQKPFAVILCCADSRVPPEIIFDQGIGDLFIVRDAGNVVDPVTLGSIEYGAEHLGAKVIMVLGHSKCGAVKATVDGGTAPGSIGAIVERIAPVVRRIKAENGTVTKQALYTETEDENILEQAHQIMGSPIIKELLEKNEIKIIGGKYDIESGEVEFIETISEPEGSSTEKTGEATVTPTAEAEKSESAPLPTTITETVNADKEIIVIPANGGSN